MIDDDYVVSLRKGCQNRPPGPGQDRYAEIMIVAPDNGGPALQNVDYRDITSLRGDGRRDSRPPAFEVNKNPLRGR